MIAQLAHVIKRAVAGTGHGLIAPHHNSGQGEIRASTEGINTLKVLMHQAQIDNPVSRFDVLRQRIITRHFISSTESGFLQG
ncbi:Uncharacterised protein [Klebsiella pneumoniae]|nr:Uncharacterised protein [Klebsiella pneumoniae]